TEVCERAIRASALRPCRSLTCGVGRITGTSVAGVELRGINRPWPSAIQGNAHVHSLDIARGKPSGQSSVDEIRGVFPGAGETVLAKGGRRGQIRTADPYRVKVVLYH